MKILKYWFFAVLLAGVVLTGCTDPEPEPEPEPVPEPEPEPVPKPVPDPWTAAA